MEYTVEFHEENSVYFQFADGEYTAVERYEDEPQPVFATISSEDDEKIGKISGYLLYDENDFYYRCDAVSGDCETIASAVCNKNGRVSRRYMPTNELHCQIFILDKIEIAPAYRNKGIASSVLSNLPEMLRYQFDTAGGVIFLCASDYTAANAHGFDSRQYEEGSKRLIEFYKKFGYRQAKGNVMFWKE